MKQKILNHVGIMVALSVVLTFIAAIAVMYGKTNEYMIQDVRNEAEYIRFSVEHTGIEELNKKIKEMTTSRITLMDSNGQVLFDSEKDESGMENHKNRPEMQEALKKGWGESIRFSSTLSKQTFYYALKLENGDILRVAKTTDSVVHTMISGFSIMGILLIVILGFSFLMVEKQTTKMIDPINRLDLEHPLSNVVYEELRPLLMRVDEQNRQIESQVKELKKAEEVRKEFSANVSHELKTPLMSISGYAEIMKNNMVPPEKVPEFAGRIYEEASRLTRLVQDIIEISKLDETTDVTFEELDLYEILEEVTGALSMPAKRKDISIQMEGKTAYVQGVSHILYEMVYNLVDNGVRYTNAGGYVRVVLTEEEKAIRLSVEDNGIGIPKEEQARIFERFYRVDKSHSRKTGGTGLGLAIVKHGAVIHDARIILNSEVGRGTKIMLVFPKISK